MTPDRVGRVESFDEGDAVVDEIVAVTRWWRHRGWCSWSERRGDEPRTTPARIGADRDELVVGPLLHQAGWSREGATDRREPISQIALAPDEVSVGSQRVPTSERHDRPGGRVEWPGDEPRVMIAAPPIGALAARIAAVQLRAAGPSRAMRWRIADRTKPRLDDIVGEVSDPSVRCVGAHTLSVDEGCDGRQQSWTGRSSGVGRDTGPP